MRAVTGELRHRKRPKAALILGWSQLDTRRHGVFANARPTRVHARRDAASAGNDACGGMALGALLCGTNAAKMPGLKVNLRAHYLQ